LLKIIVSTFEEKILKSNQVSNKSQKVLFQ